MLTAIIFSLPLTHLFAQSNEILERLPFEVIVDVVWQNKVIQIRKVLSCNMRKRLFPFVWDQDVNRVYHALPNKEVLIFEMPHVCGALNRPPRSSLTTLPKNFLPITYWVDNADTPQEAEQIVSDRYFSENPRRRFELRSFRIALADHLTVDKIEDDQRLVGLIKSSFTKYDAYFAGLFAIAIPKSVWQQYPELASELNKYAASGLVDRDLVKRTALGLLNTCESEAQGIGPAEKCLTNSVDTRPYIVPALEEGGVWRVKFDDVGVRRYFKYVDVDKLDRSGCPPENLKCNIERGTYRLEVDGKVYERPMQGMVGIFFDKKRQMLLGFSGFSLTKSTLKGETSK